VARSTQRGVLARSERDASNTTSDVQSASPEIADSNDGRDGTNKRLHPFVFDVFAEDDDELVDEGQLPAKRRRRASSASSSVCTEQARTTPVVSLPHDVELHTDFTRKEEMFGDRNCRAQEIWLHELHSDGGRKEIWLDGLASKSSLA